MDGAASACIDAPDPLGAPLGVLLAARSSCRAFRPDPVPQSTIDRVLAAAQRTASWCNSQPWHLIVTRGAATAAFADALHAYAASGAAGNPDFAFPRAYHGIYQERRRQAALLLYQALGIARDDIQARTRQTMENYRLFGAPHVALVTTDEALGIYGAVDCGGYIANFLLAAQAAGLATIPQAAIAHHAGFVRDHFGIDASRRLVCGISFGFADPAHPANTVRTRRAEPASAVTFLG